MARPLIATKLYVPKRRRGLVPRPRLTARLRRGVEARLTLVSAPAGFGKTTVLADWLAEEVAADSFVAWLSLEAADNEPATFWTYVVTALRGVAPSVGSGALDLIATSPLPTELMLTTLVNELAAAPGELWLVLDDYHLVDDHEVSGGMAFLLEHLPPDVHVALSTRADPDLPLARWRARGELVEIRAADLRFTSDEATAYLDVATDVELAGSEVAVLEERTEGWIAALQLAALSIQARDDVAGFISRFAGDDRYIVDYLVEEVLAHQPETVRTFLLQSAILDRFTGPLCDALTGRDDGTAMLRTLERANLFLVALDDRREWYRYHHLFADVLRARIQSEQPDQVALLHTRASNWYERLGLAEDAIGHALVARDFQRAAHLMELALPSIRRNRQDLTFVGWLEQLPDVVVRRSPVLTVFYGFLLMLAGDFAAAQARFDDAERVLANVPVGAAPQWADTVELHTLPATIAIYRASIANTRGDLAGSAEHARHALELAGPGDHLARGGAAGLLGLVAWARGDLAGAVETFTRAIDSLRAGGNLVDVLSSTTELADMWLAAGRPSEARRVCERALRLVEVQGAPLARAVADLHVGLSEIDLDAGDLEGARRRLESAAARGDRTALAESRYRWFVAMGRVARADGDLDVALRLLDQAEQLYRPGVVPDVRPIAAMKARIRIAQGKLGAAAGWARERGVSVTDDARYLSEFDHLTLVRLLLARHRAHPDAAAAAQSADLLDRLGGAAATSGRAGSLLEIGMLRALVHDAEGHRPQALESLAEAFAQAPEPAGQVQLFLDEGAPMLSLLRDAEQRGPVGDVVRGLLSVAAARTGDAADADPETPVVSPSLDALSSRELQVLRLLDSELSGPQIARELFVSHNTVRTHTRHIFTKLDVTSRRAAVLRARERGLM